MTINVFKHDQTSKSYVGHIKPAFSSQIKKYTLKVRKEEVKKDDCKLMDYENV